MDATSTASQTARRVVLLGWAAKAVVYLALAWLVLQLAFGTAPQEASASGALEYIARTAPGAVAIVVVGVGLLAHAVGRVLEVTVLAGPSVDAKEKAVAAVLAVAYAALAVSAFSIVGLASRSSGGGSTEQRGSAFLLGLPGGQWIVGLVGLAVAALGLYEIKQGVQKTFLKTLRTGEMSAGLRSAVERLGVAAYVTRGVIFLLLSWFLVQAAITYSADRARGLDGALREVGESSWGPVLLALVALGLFAYAAFNAVEARYRRVGVGATGTA